jgi:hypothetical protein
MATAGAAVAADSSTHLKMSEVEFIGVLRVAECAARKDLRLDTLSVK